MSTNHHYFLSNTKLPVRLSLKKKVILWQKIIPFSKGNLLAEFLNYNQIYGATSRHYVTKLSLFSSFSSFGNVQKLLTNLTSVLLYSKMLRGSARCETYWGQSQITKTIPAPKKYYKSIKKIKRIWKEWRNIRGHSKILSIGTSILLYSKVPKHLTETHLHHSKIKLTLQLENVKFFERN